MSVLLRGLRTNKEHYNAKPVTKVYNNRIQVVEKRITKINRLKFIIVNGKDHVTQFSLKVINLCVRTHIHTYNTYIHTDIYSYIVTIFFITVNFKLTYNYPNLKYKPYYFTHYHYIL